MVDSATALTLRIKILYGLGFVPDVVMSSLITTLGLMIYKFELGVPANLIGLAMALPLLWQGFTDPIIGGLSDRCQSRWGRRRPFMTVGAVAAGVLCMVLWSPPSSLGTTGLFWWLLVVSVLYLTAYAAYSVPYQALGLELVSSDRDRASLASYRAAANNFAYIVILPFVPLLVTNGMLGGSPIESVQVLGLLLGILIIVLGLTAAITCQDRPLKTATTQHGKGPGLITGIKIVVSDRAFLMVTGVLCFALFGFVLSMTLPYAVNLAIVFPGGTAESKHSAASMSTWSTIIGNVLALGFCPLIGPLAQRFGRKRILLAGMGILMASFLSTPVLFSQQWPWLQLLYKIIDTPAIAIVYVLTIPMLAEVCDRDEIIHDVCRQGVFSAMFNWGIKATMALVLYIGGFVIEQSGFNKNLAVQSPETVAYLRWMFALGPLPFLAAAMYFTVRFPLTSLKIQALRQAKASGPIPKTAT
jgi:glycoside/pentoside/hexuronide:cation symporter, GPH family